MPPKRHGIGKSCMPVAEYGLFEPTHLFLRFQQTMQVPLHLREDFCGTALLASTWCRGDIVKRTAVGLDIDRDALTWGMQHNGEGLAGAAMQQLLRCLTQSSSAHGRTILMLLAVLSMLV